MREHATSVAALYDGIRVFSLRAPERAGAAGFDMTERQVGWSPIEEPSCSWMTSYLERLDGREARREYYAHLEEAALR